MNILAAIFLILFCLTIFASYIIIRRGLMRTQVAGSLCAVLTTTFIFAFGLAQDLQLAHAVAAGLFTGLLFSGVTVLMASFFRVNQPSALEAYLPQDRTLQK